MDNTGLLLTCLPGEGRVALRAPHLITALNLRNKCTASWASTTVLSKELCRCQNIGLAGMRSILGVSLDFVALRARPLITEAALPRSAEKSAAGRIRALLNEDILSLGSLTLTSAKQTNVVCNFILLYVQLVDLLL